MTTVTFLKAICRPGLEICGDELNSRRYVIYYAKYVPNCHFRKNLSRQSPCDNLKHLHNSLPIVVYSLPCFSPLPQPGIFPLVTQFHRFLEAGTLFLRLNALAYPPRDVENSFISPPVTFLRNNRSIDRITFYRVLLVRTSLISTLHLS